MGNHYHLCVETPEPNLVEGMKWLQGTFANRFNRFRKMNGHVFQGRYKAILLDWDAVAAVCHYIHLNPVRSGLVEAESLQTYEQGSFHQLWNRRKRWSFQEFGMLLESTGSLADSPKGRKLYRDYLEWLSEEEPERQRLGFESMSRGWAKGTKEFKKAVVEDLRDEDLRKVVEAEAAEMREPRWQRALGEMLDELGKGDFELEAARMVPYAWIAENLRMGAVSSVQSQVSLNRKKFKEGKAHWSILKS